MRSANELINTALAPYPDDLVIATKVGPGRDPSGEWLDWARPDQLRGQVEENLRQLGRDHLDLVNLRAYRSARSPSTSARWPNCATPGSSATWACPTSGPSTWPRPGPSRRWCACRTATASARRPEARDVLRACGEQGVAFVPFFAIAGDARERRPDGADHDAVLAVAAAHGVAPAQVRLAWTLQQGPHVLAIPGTGNPDHLADNVAAGALRLTPGEIACLEAIS